MKKLVLGVLLVAGSGVVQAGEFALGTSIGTPGIGVQGTYGLTESLNVRGVVNFFSTDIDEQTAGIDYDLDLDLQSVGAMLDWHPGGGTFRISAGVFSNGNDLSGIGRGRPGTFVEFGDELFPVAELGQINAEADFDSVAPYLGIGLGNAVRDAGWSFALDLGVYFQGDPEVTLSAPDVDPSIADEVEAERAGAEAALEAELDNLDVYPYVSVGFAYRF